MSLTQEETNLLGVQDIDLKLAQIDEQLTNAPHKQRVAAVRTKVVEGKKRLALIERARADLEQQITEHQSQIDELSKRMQAQQTTMQQSSDHRAIENLSRELESLLKQKEKHENTALKLMEKRSEFGAVYEDTAAKTAQLTEIEATELAVYKEYYQKLRMAQAAAEKQREALTVEISPTLLSRYEKTRDTKNGIGVARYSSGKCGACSVMVPDAQRSQIENATGIQSCPSCKRLLVLER
ncbi:MAG: hypothetical protein FWC81_02330 [Coriobacteriia bacterium]|nr:hypothetical protein [Coriobacteriia bacterium]